MPSVWPLEKSLGASKTETQTLIKRSKFFSIKYSESNKRTLIIYFNELLSSPLERSLGFGLSVRPAKCEEALRACKFQLLSSLHPKQFEIHSLCTQLLELEVGYDLILYVIAMWL